MSVKEWNSFASLRPWVDSGVAIDRTMTGTLMGATGISSLPSQNAKHTYAVARSEAFDIRAKDNDTDLSVFSWLIAGTETQTRDPSQVTQAISTRRPHCRTVSNATEDHAPTELHVFNFLEFGTKACQEKGRDPPQTYHSTEPLETAQSLPWSDDEEKNLTDAVFKQVQEQIADCSVQLEETSTACNLCFRSGRDCDLARPCSWCSKKRRSCTERGQLGPWGQDPQTKCHPCRKIGSRCDGERPCGACIRHKSTCREQGEEAPPRSGQDPKAKCYRCRRIGSRCNGEWPCGACIKYNNTCIEQGETLPRRGQDAQTKCHSCFTQRRRCNKERPCGSCVKLKKRCKEQYEARPQAK
jgi:hypothetical protein